jgi:hypothetical protein
MEQQQEKETEMSEENQPKNVTTYCSKCKTLQPVSTFDKLEITKPASTKTCKRHIVVSTPSENVTLKCCICDAQRPISHFIRAELANRSGRVCVAHMQAICVKCPLATNLRRADEFTMNQLDNSDLTRVCFKHEQEDRKKMREEQQQEDGKKEQQEVDVEKMRDEQQDDKSNVLDALVWKLVNKRAEAILTKIT